jgi:amino-acid N-acetyltransferase
MSPQAELASAHPADRAAVCALLADADLPTTDVAPDLEGFDVARVGGAVVGCAALEKAGDTGLLRSVVVATGHRSQALGRALVGDPHAKGRSANLNWHCLIRRWFRREPCD